jgi:hypothetical protein
MFAVMIGSRMSEISLLAGSFAGLSTYTVLPSVSAIS